MPGDTDMIGDLDLTPMLNSVDQLTRHLEALPGQPVRHPARHRHEPAGDGAGRMGGGGRDLALSARPELLMCHLACADEPDHR